MTKKWQKKLLYHHLTSAIPLVARLTPESILILNHLGINYVSDICKLVRFTQPMQLDELPDGEFEFTISPKRFVNLFSETPSNHVIMQTKIMGRFIFVNTVRIPHGLYHEHNKLGILREGDFKLELVNENENHIYYVKVNNRERSASVLYGIDSSTGKVLADNVNEIFKKFLDNNNCETIQR